jgi:hypothetical protein
MDPHTRYWSPSLLFKTRAAEGRVLGEVSLSTLPVPHSLCGPEVLQDKRTQPTSQCGLPVPVDGP